MNRFQEQLVMNDGRTLAEQTRHHVERHGAPPPPQRVSITDFEKDVSRTKEPTNAGK